MNTKFLSVFVLAFVIVLSACSPVFIVPSTGEQPTPTGESLTPTAYQPVDVSQVEVEVGVGSPIPVHLHVSGNLPDTCAQIELVEEHQEGSNFFISLYTIASNGEGCVQDSLPFKMSFPLNVVNLPAGSYTVEVNGSSADFKLDTGNTSASLPASDSVLTQDDIQVDHVDVEIGVGSPIPVHAMVSLNLPNTCAQLGQIRLHREGTTFYVRLIASIAERADCQADSIPFRAEIPLNIVNLPEGPYEVNVNGVTASFDPRTQSPSNGEAEALEERNLIPVEHVGIQAGVGSPIPVDIVASGAWPDLCAQIAEVQSEVDGFNINITVLASTVEACPPDHLGLPFRFAIPLNIVEMPEGTYTITVNGTSTTLDLPLHQ